jgi:hypothetical protein
MQRMIFLNVLSHGVLALLRFWFACHCPERHYIAKNLLLKAIPLVSYPVLKAPKALHGHISMLSRYNVA